MSSRLNRARSTAGLSCERDNRFATAHSLMILGTKYAARAVALLLGLVSVTASATIYTVTNTNDTGAGSLRQAIVNANSADSIVFNIPGPGPYSINPVSPLQPLKHPVTIDGTTQPGYSGVPLVELN